MTSNKLILFAAFVVCMLLMSVNRRRTKKRVVFFGDSITEQGAEEGGYVRLLQRWAAKNEDLKDFDLVGAGISGNKVTHLKKRLQKDVLANGAEVVIIYIGINDVWHKDRKGRQGTESDVFEEIYRAIISRLKEAAVQVVLCTPTVIGEDIDFLTEPNADLETYCAIVKKLGEENDLPVVDLRTAFMEYIRQHNEADAPYGILTRDGVHLNEEGNQLVAAEIWKVLEPLLQD